MKVMKSLLNHFDPITLEQMSDIRLMNRTDTKFVTTRSRLEQLLMLAKDDYYVQEIDGERIAPYYTLYFDTEDHAMYTAHESGHTNRQKLRIRSYVNSGLNFLEVKTKNNHGRTKKKRIEVGDMNLADEEKRLVKALSLLEIFFFRRLGSLIVQHQLLTAKVDKSCIGCRCRCRLRLIVSRLGRRRQRAHQTGYQCVTYR
jgi:hypothetical protein